MDCVVTEHDDFEPLRPEWDALLAEASSRLGVFSTWDWQRAWWQFFGAEAVLRLIAVRGDGALIGLWPLMQRGRTATLVGGVELCDYLDVIARRGREREVLAAGLERLTGDGISALDLRFVPDCSSTRKLLPELASECGWQVEASIDDVCPIVDVASTWEDYLAGLRKKDRHELRRKLRRLEEAGEPRWEVAGGAAGLEQDTADFVRLHRLSRAEKATFMDEQMERFFGAVIALFRPREVMKNYFLRLNGERVAATLCIEHGDELWVYNSGFDRDYLRYSVGLALKAFCIKDAIERGKKRVDLLRGREPYKYDLGARDVPVHRLLLTRPT